MLLIKIETVTSGFKGENMNRKFIALLILLSLFCLTCVSAQDFDNSTVDSSSIPEDNNKLKASVEPEDNIASPESENILANSKVSSDSSSAFLVLDNDADKENIHVGDYVTWILSVDNYGPDNAKNVKVHNQLPEGMKYIKHNTTKGTFNPKTGIWKIGTVLKDTQEYLFITALAITSCEKINKANLTTDSINLNNKTFEEEEIDVLENEENSEKHIVASNTLNTTGTPIYLVLLSLFGCLMAYVKRH